MSASGVSTGRSRILSVSVDTSGPWSAVDSTSSSSAGGGVSPTAAISGGFARGGSHAPPPPKSPLHGARRATPQAEESAPALESRGVDRMLLLRQMNVTSSAGYQSASATHEAAPRPKQLPPGVQQAPAAQEVSAAQNHKERKAAEARRRQEVALMTLEDYTGTPEGFARLARQEERANMQEEEVRMLRIVQAEKAQLRAQQAQAQREEEARIREVYLAKLRAEREENERAAKEKEAARKQAMEEKMKALKAAADAKARDEYAARQRQLAAEALEERERRTREMESAQLAVEDELAVAMRQDFLAEQERKQQIAAEEAQWKHFQEVEAQRQLEETMRRRASQAAQYEQDKQRRMEIHRLQKERARLTAEKKNQKMPKDQPSEAVVSSLPEQAAVEAEDAASAVNAVIEEGGESTPSTPGSDDDGKTLTISALQDDAAKDGPHCSGLQEKETAEPQQEPHTSEALPLSCAEGAESSHEPAVASASIAEEEEGVPDAPARVSSEPERMELVPIVCREDNEGQEAGAVVSIPPTESGSEVDHQSEAKQERYEIGDHTDQEKPSLAKELEEAATQSLQTDAHPDVLDQERSAAAEQNVVPPPERLDEVPSPVDVVEGAVQNAGGLESTTLSNSNEVAATPPLLKELPLQLLSAHEARVQGLDPFAQVLHVKGGSPAMEATLRAGDLLANFGGITGATPNCLLLIADKVKSSVGRAIKLVVLRPHEDAFTRGELVLQPRKWTGKGLLGCQLNPFKWAAEDEDLGDAPEEEPQRTAQETTNSTLLVFYRVTPYSVADQIGIKDGDLLMKCGALAAVDDLGAVLDCFQAARAARTPIELEIQRWFPEEQHYQQFALSVPVLVEDEPLGCSMTTFAEYYGAATSDASALSACTECYYTSLATAVHAAALNGHVACLEALLEASRQGHSEADEPPSVVLDWRDEDGRSPLFYACYAQQVASVRFLLAHLAREDAFDPRDLYGDSPLHAATMSGSVEILALLLESEYVAVDVVNAAQLACAHVAPNAEVLQLLGERFGADLLVADSDGRMPLAHACLRGDLASVAYLCEKHPDFVDYADASGNTPLHLSAWLGLLDVLRELVKHVPPIALFLPNQDGASPLEVARASGFDDAVQFLEACMAASSSEYYEP